ncbi:deoxyribonuclease [Ateline alphaherpesvirus 1]|uniref:Deoxyribonuclease n=1 Tax=Herpesvirus ateles type 1 (strain Lennette) TaxID=35243 RepID=A0A1S6JLP9_HSVA1|nr:deoxyribonuclease [Ateline alphaherpesvirus 1]AQS79204.1 deoxyribonuclease [Ateline alphaherpesvirus 1]
MDVTVAPPGVRKRGPKSAPGDSDDEESQSLLANAPAWLLPPPDKRPRVAAPEDDDEDATPPLSPARPPTPDAADAGTPRPPTPHPHSPEGRRAPPAAAERGPRRDCARTPPADPAAWSPPAVPDALAARVTAHTFEHHLASLAAGGAARVGALGAGAGGSRLLEAGPLAARADYLCALAAALEAEGLSERGLASALSRMAGGGAAGRLNPRAPMLFFEAATRTQSESGLWALLRRGLVTASSLRWGPAGPRFPARWLDENTAPAPDGFAAAIAFGRTNELTARTLLFRYLVDADEGAEGAAAEPRFVFDDGPDGAAAGGGPHACGLLFDAHTGMTGASLDVLVCPRDGGGGLAPRPGRPLPFFEIKCRAKYLFDPLDPRPPIAAAYEALLRDRTPRAFRDFVGSIARPGVRYFDAAGAPGPEEALVTCACAWRNPAAAEPRRRCPPGDRRLLELNRGLRSEVVLFDQPDVRRRTIGPVRWSSGGVVHREPIFANPRHAAFKQILVQAYVLDSHFPDSAPRPHLVTFIGRLRRPEEEGLRFELADGHPPAADDRPRAPGPASVAPEQAIPVALIVTPVAVDAGAFAVLRRDSLAAFDATVVRRWGRR